MVSLGVAIGVRGAIQMLWGTEPQRLPRASKPFYHIEFEVALPGGGALPFDIRIPPDNIFLGLSAIALVGALYLFLNRTRIGKAMRATSDNIDLARVTGINTTRIIQWTWIIAAAYAAIAGTLIAVSQAQMLPNSGWNTANPDVRGGYSWRHWQALGRAGRRAAHRRNDGGVNRVDDAGVQARGGIHHNAACAAYTPKGAVRRRELTSIRRFHKCRFAQSVSDGSPRFLLSQE